MEKNVLILDEIEQQQIKGWLIQYQNLTLIRASNSNTSDYMTKILTESAFHIQSVRSNIGNTLTKEELPILYKFFFTLRLEIQSLLVSSEKNAQMLKYQALLKELQQIISRLKFF